MRPPQDNQLKTTPATAEPIRPQLTSQPVQDKFAGQPKQTNLWQFSEARSHRQTQLNQHLWPGVDEFLGTHSIYKTLLQLKKDFRKWLLFHCYRAKLKSR